MSNKKITCEQVISYIVDVDDKQPRAHNETLGETIYSLKCAGLNIIAPNKKGYFLKVCPLQLVYVKFQFYVYY